MQNFIVLGYVPGTHIQINFSTWLIVFLLFSSLTFVALRQRQIRYRIVALRLAYHIRQHQLTS